MLSTATPVPTCTLEQPASISLPHTCTKIPRVGRQRRSDVSLSPSDELIVLETCCLLKYVEPREKGEGVFGFSIRQMGFYHNVNLATQLETTILMSPSVELWTRLKIHLTDSSSSAKSRKHWSHTPLLAFTSLAAGWTGYVGALHAAVAQIMNDAAFYRPEGSLKVVDTETLKRSAVVKDRLQHASHVLQNNIETLRAALDEYRRRKAQLQDHGDTEYQAFQQGVQDTMRELHFIQNQIQLIAQRLDQTCASVSKKCPLLVAKPS